MSASSRMITHSEMITQGDEDLRQAFRRDERQVGSRDDPEADSGRALNEAYGEHRHARRL